MNKTLLVLRHEILTALRSKSFIFFVFVLPLIGIVIFVVASLLKGDAVGTPSPSTAPSDRSELKVEGYVDESALIKTIPPDVPEGILVPYPDEASARQALEAGEIAAYYVISSDYVQSGNLIYVNPNYSLTTDEDQSWTMRQTLLANLLGNDAERLARASQPMDLQVNALSPATERDGDNPLTFFIPYATMLIFYMVIMVSASLLLNSVSNEKKNRVMEILLLSVTPQEMLTGKIVGLGLLGLLQVTIWGGTGYAMLRMSGRTFNLPAEFQLPPSILAWGLLFFLLGYATYASLMAGLGALAPNLKEASQAVIVVIWPLLIPMLFLVSLIEKTHGVLAIGLSLFPLTAPIAMITRLAVGGVPWWQPVLSSVLLALTTVFIIRSVSRMFRAQTLLSGQSSSVRQFYAALLGRM